MWFIFLCYGYIQRHAQFSSETMFFQNSARCVQLEMHLARLVFVALQVSAPGIKVNCSRSPFEVIDVPWTRDPVIASESAIVTTCLPCTVESAFSMSPARTCQSAVVSRLDQHISAIHLLGNDSNFYFLNSKCSKSLIVITDVQSI